MSSRSVQFLLALAFIATFMPSTIAQKADPAAWADLQKKARAEGELNVTGPPSPRLRAELSAAFKERHGVTLNYIGESTGAIIARIDTEFKAGKPSIGAHIGGITTCWIFAQRGQIEDINGKLVDPDLMRPSIWRSGAPRLNEVAGTATGPAVPKCAFQFTEWVFTLLFANTNVTKPPIESWNDLLKPEFKGKIAAFDPRSSGPGEPPVAFLAKVMGRDYMKKLYLGQGVRFSSDNRQLAEWVARGEISAGIGLVPFAVEIYRKQGLPIAAVAPKEGAGPLTSGFGTVMLFKNSPSPNAAQVFANWIGTKEAQEIYERNMMEKSLRTDVSTGDSVPDYVRPQANVNYPINDNLYSYHTDDRRPAIDDLKKDLPK